MNYEATLELLFALDPIAELGIELNVRDQELVRAEFDFVITQ